MLQMGILTPLDLSYVSSLSHNTDPGPKSSYLKQCFKWLCFGIYAYYRMKRTPIYLWFRFIFGSSLLSFVTTDRKGPRSIRAAERLFTYDEVCDAVEKGGQWVAVIDGVYDVKGFLGAHPGKIMKGARI